MCRLKIRNGAAAAISIHRVFTESRGGGGYFLKWNVAPFSARTFVSAGAKRSKITEKSRRKAEQTRGIRRLTQFDSSTRVYSSASLQLQCGGICWGQWSLRLQLIKVGNKFGKSWLEIRN